MKGNSGNAAQFICCALAGLGILLATILYIWRPAIPGNLAKKFPGLYKLILEKYRIDELYAFCIVNPIKYISERFLWKKFDDGIIDATVNGVGKSALDSGSLLRLLENGVVHRYASSIVIGLIGIMVYILVTIY